MATLLLWSTIAWTLGVAPAEERAPDAAQAPRVKLTRRTVWEIVFPDGISVQEYARQLDYFKIELAAVAKGGRAEYLFKVSSRKPEKRIGDATRDDRWRIAWVKGTLDAADRSLLSKAGINTRDKQLLHFFPEPIEARLGQLERAHAQGRPDEIRRTRFEIRPLTKDDGYEIVVVEQEPPGPDDSPSVKSANRPRGD
jgi:hypothetical protein